MTTDQFKTQSRENGFIIVDIRKLPTRKPVKKYKITYLRDTKGKVNEEPQTNNYFGSLLNIFENNIFSQRKEAEEKEPL